MTYIPHTPAERETMMKAVGVKTLEDLFAHLPADVKAPVLKQETGLGEMELLAEMQRRAKKNSATNHLTCFLGAGAYDHFLPPVIDQLILRGELYSAYTPYQPEISQGVLQIIYEYQTMMASLNGCDVSNASLYDGATAVVEAGQILVRHTGRNVLLIDGAIHPNYIACAKSMLGTQGIEIKVISPKPGDFKSDTAALGAALGENVAGILVGYPNFYGSLTDIAPLAEATRKAGALLGAVSSPFAFGLLQPPGALGADVVCGEAQALGVPLQYGGPYVGHISCKKELVRRMPGRLVGHTLDVRGQRAFTLTLQAREQHIRREKATSNICTNTALCAMMAHFYLCCMGRNGLKRAGELCVSKTDELRRKLRGVKGISNVPEYPVFNEFVFETVKPAKDVLAALLKKGILGGYDLGKDDPARANQILVAVTEKRTSAEIEAYVAAIS